MSNRHKVPVIGLVGGVGSGKSSIAARLARRRPITVVDGDEAGHAALKDTSVKQRIRRRFGDEVFDERGEVSRAALARRVFGSDPAEQRAREDLQRIVHPRIRHSLRERIQQAEQSGQADAVILDAAVLLEAGWDGLCDAVVFVDVPRPIRLQRVAEGRGWDEDELKRREESQLPVEAKRERADLVIDNSGTLDEAVDRLDEAVRRLTGENGP